MYKIFLIPFKMDIPKKEKVFLGIYFFSIVILIFEITFTFVTGSRLLFTPGINEFTDKKTFFYTSIGLFYILGTIACSIIVYEYNFKGKRNFSYLQYIKNKEWQKTRKLTLHLRIAGGLTCSLLFLLLLLYVVRGFNSTFYYVLELFPNLESIKFNLNLLFNPVALSASIIAISLFGEWFEKKKPYVTYLCLGITLSLCYLTFYYQRI